MTAPLRLLLDQGVPRDAASLLRKAGIVCEHVGELGRSRAEDLEILHLARERHAVLVTLDADFHTILAVTTATGPSVIRLRQQGLSGSRVADMVTALVNRFETELTHGCLITVKARKTTCHRLPIEPCPNPQPERT